MRKVLIFLACTISFLAKAQVPTPNAANGIIVCVGSTGSFSPQTIDPTYTYTFSIDNGETVTQTFPTQGQITWDSPGVYNLTITTSNGGVCPPVVSTAVITVQPQGVLNLADLQDCISSAPITLNGPAGSVYIPTNGGAVVGNQFTAPAGTYLIDVVFTDPNGCVSTGTVQVTVDPLVPPAVIYTDQ
jgi:hypothetical protein